MDLEIKKQAFEYLLTQLLNWGAGMTPKVPVLSFTRLKALKLLFFSAAIKDEQGNDLLGVFDNFYALPNGPVESDIYNYIISDQLTYYTFKNYSFSTKQSYDEGDLDDNLKVRIRSAVDSLKQKNEQIVAYNAEQLVSLSHIWLAWQDSINIARALGKGSFPMDIEKIRNNSQIFTI